MPQRGWYDLSALVDDVLGRLRSVTSRHQVVVSVEEELPPVFLDYILIDEVLANLIENATKYTPPGSEITVRATRDGRRCPSGSGRQGAGHSARGTAAAI